ncbi:MAG: response regulator, partial [Acidobacteriota bacterium]
GSTFFFDLPVAGEAATADTTLTAAAPVARPVPVATPANGSTTKEPAPGDTEPPHASGRDSDSAIPGDATVLVVDDEEIIRQVLSNQLGTEGFHVLRAASGPQALQQLAEHSVDLVILDVMMPRMSGFEVCEKLRRSYSLEELPILFLTAKNRAEDLVIGLTAGANDYLPKPVSKGELLARVRTHLALLRVNRQLDGLVSERTSQLAERDQLIGQREELISELESRNADLARFNYSVAHDLKNPLTTIRNFVGLLETHAEQGDREGLHDDLRRIDGAASTLHHMVEQLGEFSRVDHLAMASDAVDLGELAHQAVADLAPLLAERSVTIEIGADLPTVRGDRARLLLVVRHLLSNAVKYLGEATEPRIEIGSRPGEPDPSPTFFVRDNGIGIETKYHERVFGLFERLDPAATPGTGIGLALVRRIVEVHGGRIWVESPGVGQGSTFCLVLPTDSPA